MKMVNMFARLSNNAVDIIQVANRTACGPNCLPHDMRTRVLETVHPTRWQCGRELVDLSRYEDITIVHFYNAIWGEGREEGDRQQ